ncbi:NADH-quinone oxidoreductase subunit J [Marinomonas spartinae]|uniref:NADH-quinone oxidoreductase subunit J n=1 Tax=Marinomonas spartinae TaxID=1792290 RepID=A0A1A8TCV7_9GAMM|nr:NADH-quinone oxidoreductase subunit J [Marinomonas spartinae]SBS30924.1 NADH-quinone oxidoreductase subunit J [Marinomonas spartinae]SBS33262.1 NADH-quinone oxidoreductase subunit J [Marinomonas spartinae]
MDIVFYVAAAIAVLTTVRVISHTNPVHALLYLIVSLLAVAVVFFSMGANFAGALEIIVYAGAIMVLFVFVVMMLNLGGEEIRQERQWLSPSLWIGPGIISALLLIAMVYGINSLQHGAIHYHMLGGKSVGVSLFGPYVLAVELASLLLLAGLVVAFHVGRDKTKLDSMEEEA